MSSEKTELVAPETVVSPASSDPFAVLRTVPPLLVDAKTLVEGFRYLQHRIPDYTQLSVDEARSLIRVAHLDPEFLEVGIQTAGVWDETASVVGRSSDQLRREADEIREWDEVERQLTAVLKGIAAANLKRKHRLGSAILKIYNILGLTINLVHNRHLRPYFDDLKRAYLKRRKKARKSAAEAEPEASKD